MLGTLPGLYLGAAPTPAPVQKSAWQSCTDYLTFLVYRYERPYLSPEEKRVWKEWLAPEGESMALYLNRLGEDGLWDAYTRIPSVVRDRIEMIPPGRVATLHFLTDLAHELALPYLPPTLVANVVESYANERDFHRRKLPPMREWIRGRLAEREKKLTANPELAAQWRALHAQLVEEYRATQYWYRAFQVDLPFERTGGNKIRVSVGQNVYAGHVRNGEAILWVPASQVAHPAWNPLSETNLMYMARDRVPPPDAWPTSVGLDGKFYLQDGNHRFAISGKQEVWVRIAFPPRTEPLRIFLDTWGVTQPRMGDVVRLYRGETTIWEFLPKHAKSKLTLLPEQALPGTSERTVLPK